MTPSPHTPEFDVSRPGSLIAALPAVLGFVPEQSLVLVSIEDGHLGCVMRLDLSLMMTDAVDELAEVAAASQPDGAIAVIVNEDGADCQHCCDIHAEMADTVEDALSLHGIELIAAYVVDRVAAGGRWHCAYGCAKRGVIEDPSASPLAVAAVLDGRRLYRRRADLAQIVEPDESRGERMRAVIAGLPTPPPARRRAEVRADIESALSSAAELADGQCPADAQLARLAVALTDPQVRDTLYALAVGERAGQAESLWVELSRALPPPWRAEALVLLAFSAYVRGDGPLAGISLDAALRCVPDHRMAGMLDRALRSGMRPDQIRELALSGYRQADRLGVRLPPRQTLGGEARKAGA
ncbi:hypothetical protein AFM11_17760 [Mycolicibacterium wolinskyi]|uniref:DUF4192 domain-containing protein n=1 Tax=Mycolicibacterium wolinskyi TaxID=59750 RepID=A0A132PKP7_9MYCO|nr:DUF4192 domain-containing protein [Mycolicibacterium wolinskyi]KWX22916.1 hypothetical protein AFM11_17760 [Mycolicibacterium wolinskyi]